MYFVFQIRLPTAISDEVEEDPTGVKALWDRGWLGGSSQKVIIYLMCAENACQLFQIIIIVVKLKNILHFKNIKFSI